MPLHEFALMIFPVLLIAGAVWDLLTMTIPNRLSIALAAAFPVLAILGGMGPEAIGWHVLMGVVVLLIGFGMFALFQLGWIGGGDAKLAVAVVLWLGAGQAPAFLLYSALFGGVFTLVLLQFRLLPLTRVWRAPPWVARLHSRGSGVPYAVPMATAALTLLPHTAWMAAIR